MNGSQVKLQDHSFKMLFAIASLVIGLALAFLILPAFGWVLLLPAIIDYLTLLYQIHHATSPADNEEINTSLNVMISMGIIGAAPIWEAAEGVGLVLWAFAAYFTTLIGAEFTY